MKSILELFRRLEREVRTPRERLPIDAFLPSPESIPTEFPNPPPSHLTAHVREMGTSGEEERDQRERRRARRGRKPSAEQETAAKNIEEEIAEFLNRDRPEGLQEDDTSQFLGGFDPSHFPEGEK